MCFGLEVDPDLTANDEGVVDFPGPTRPEDVLKIWLEEHRALGEIKTVRPFQNRFVVLNAYRWIEQLLTLLCVPQVAAEVTVNHTDARHVRWPGRKEAASYNACSKKIWHLADRVVWRKQE
jgi:hypothetical protein